MFGWKSHQIFSSKNTQKTANRESDNHVNRFSFRNIHIYLGVCFGPFLLKLNSIKHTNKCVLAPQINWINIYIYIVSVVVDRMTLTRKVRRTNEYVMLYPCQRPKNVFIFRRILTSVNIYLYLQNINVSHKKSIKFVHQIFIFVILTKMNWYIFHNVVFMKLKVKFC